MIRRILIENYKCLTSLEIKPKALTVITGANEVGKTTVLQALEDLFTGGHQPQRIRTGAKKARIEVQLDGGVLIEKSITPKSTTVKITDESGEEVKSPQAYLDKLASGFGFDPLGLIAAKPKDRAAFILSAIQGQFQFRRDAIPEVFTPAPGATSHLSAIHAAETLADAPEVMDLPTLDALRKSIYDRRTRHNVLAKDAAATVQNLRKALPDEDGDIDWTSRARLLEQEERGLTGDLNVELEAIRMDMERDIQEIRKEAERLMEEQRQTARNREADFRSKAAPVIQAKHEEVVTARKNAEDQIRVSEIRKQIDREQAKAADNSAASDRLTSTLEAIDTYKTRKLAESPIDGIEIRDGDVFVGGVQFDECNTATQILTSFRIAALSQGELGFMICDQAEALDEDNWQMFCDAATQSGYQVLAARVEAGLPLTVETCDAA